MKRKKVAIGIVTTGIILAAAAIAFAHGGYGRHMGGYSGSMMGPGYGGGHMMDFGTHFGPHMRGYGRWSGLSEENAAKIDAARDDFYDETRELRTKIDDARIALRDELGNEQPSETKLADLQNQLSELQAEFDQKSLAYQLKVGKLLPQSYRGKDYGGGYCW